MNGRLLDDVALLLAEDDTVATAVADLSASDEVVYDGRTVRLVDDVAFGHKVALTEHRTGDEVRKYGEVIGRATEVVAAGEWVHTHNCESTRGRGDLPVGEGGDA